MARNELNKELDTYRAQFRKKYADARKATSIKSLPYEATPQSAILDIVKGHMGKSKVFYDDGANIGGACYIKDNTHWDFIAEVMKVSIISNPIHIDEFIFVTQMEAEILRWTLDLYNGGPETCGIVTGGGSESILLAMLSYREQALAERGVTKPNIVMSETAHAAFDKAGFYFGIEMRKVAILSDFTLDLQGMKGMIDSNTVCLISSAPEYAFGIYDPLESVAALA